MEQVNDKLDLIDKISIDQLFTDDTLIKLYDDVSIKLDFENKIKIYKIFNFYVKELKLNDNKIIIMNFIVINYLMKKTLDCRVASILINELNNLYDVYGSQHLVIQVNSDDSYGLNYFNSYSFNIADEIVKIGYDILLSFNSFKKFFETLQTNELNPILLFIGKHYKSSYKLQYIKEFYDNFLSCLYRYLIDLDDNEVKKNINIYENSIGKSFNLKLNFIKNRSCAITNKQLYNSAEKIFLYKKEKALSIIDEAFDFIDKNNILNGKFYFLSNIIKKEKFINLRTLEYKNYLYNYIVSKLTIDDIMQIRDSNNELMNVGLYEFKIAENIIENNLSNEMVYKLCKNDYYSKNNKKEEFKVFPEFDLSKIDNPEIDVKFIKNLIILYYYSSVDSFHKLSKINKAIEQYFLNQDQNNIVEEINNISDSNIKKYMLLSILLILTRAYKFSKKQIKKVKELFNIDSNLFKKSTTIALFSNLKALKNLLLEKKLLKSFGLNDTYSEILFFPSLNGNIAIVEHDFESFDDTDIDCASYEYLISIISQFCRYSEYDTIAININCNTFYKFILNKKYYEYECGFIKSQFASMSGCDQDNEIQVLQDLLNDSINDNDLTVNKKNIIKKRLNDLIDNLSFRKKLS